MDYSELSEEGWLELLDARLSLLDSTFSLFTVKREYGRGAYYIASIVIRTASNNVAIVEELLAISLASDGVGMFRGSEIDMQGGNLEVDFLYFDIKINIRKQ